MSVDWVVVITAEYANYGEPQALTNEEFRPFGFVCFVRVFASKLSATQKIKPRDGREEEVFFHLAPVETLRDKRGDLRLFPPIF